MGGKAKVSLLMKLLEFEDYFVPVQRQWSKKSVTFTVAQLHASQGFSNSSSRFIQVYTHIWNTWYCFCLLLHRNANKLNIFGQTEFSEQQRVASAFWNIWMRRSPQNMLVLEDSIISKQKSFEHSMCEGFFFSKRSFFGDQHFRTEHKEGNLETKQNLIEIEGGHKHGWLNLPVKKGVNHQHNTGQVRHNHPATQYIMDLMFTIILAYRLKHTQDERNGFVVVDLSCCVNKSEICNVGVA